MTQNTDNTDRIAANRVDFGTRSWRFEYIGDGALTIEGTASGAAYRFTQRGQVLEVACEDSSALSAMPQLRPI